MTKTILITGASRGIGAASARIAASRGYAVCINYLKNERAAMQLQEDIQKAGGRAVTIQADVSKESEVISLFEQAENALGPLYGLVNNAGVIALQSRLEDMSAERMLHIFQQNTLSTFLSCREAVKRMSTRNGGSGGSIVNVSSIASRIGSPNEYIDYAAAKAAVDTLTIGLSKEVATEHIRVNAVRPGLIYTDIHASGGEPGRVERLKGSVPMQRGGQPDEVAQAILWLLSEEASYVTGTILDVGSRR